MPTVFPGIGRASIAPQALPETQFARARVHRRIQERWLLPSPRQCADLDARPCAGLPPRRPWVALPDTERLQANCRPWPAALCAGLVPRTSREYGSATLPAERGFP